MPTKLCGLGQACLCFYETTLPLSGFLSRSIVSSISKSQSFSAYRALKVTLLSAGPGCNS